MITIKQNMNLGEYQLTTIERLAPSLQQINFQLTHTALGEQKKVQSLAFSVSIQKISFNSIKANDHSFETEKSLRLQQKVISISEESKNKQAELKQSGSKLNNSKARITENKYRKKRETVHITKAILYFEDPKQMNNLQSTSSSIKNNSPVKNAKYLIPQTFKNRTKKSISIKISPSNNIKTQKYLLPNQSNKQNKKIAQLINFRPETRKKILSTRK